VKCDIRRSEEAAKESWRRKAARHDEKRRKFSLTATGYRQCNLAKMQSRESVVTGKLAENRGSAA